MEENFKTEIVSPEKVIFSGNSIMTTLPAYEGDMTILKNHINKNSNNDIGCFISGQTSSEEMLLMK